MDWSNANQQALADKIIDSDAVENLSKLRAGDTTAASLLTKGLTYLVFEFAFDWADKSGKRRPDDIIGPLFVGLSKAIERLVKNDKSNPVAFVREELRRRVRARGRETSRNILPSAQANSYRKREGLPLYEGLTRVECNPQEDVETSVIEQVDYQGPELRDKYHAYRGASKYHNSQEGLEMVNFLDQFAHDPDLTMTAQLTLAGHTIPEIASMTNFTEYRVRRHREEIVELLGAEKPVAAPVQLAGSAEAADHPPELELALAV
jgi:hypothetical protein